MGPRWCVKSASVGAFAWLVAPYVPVGAPPTFGSIEHVFTFLPLVAAPLALILLSTMVEPSPYRVAIRVQPAAALMVLASFFLAKGVLGGALTVGWLVMALTVAVSGIRRMGRGALARPNLLAAHLFLPVGAVWLLLSRHGVGPRSFSALTVFLAAVHFHFSGFTLQILIEATGRELRASASRLSAVHRWVAIGAIVGIPLIAAGNALASPVVKLVGVASMVLSVIGLAVTSSAVALASPSPVARGLLLVSAASVAAAMLLAGVYGVGEISGERWIGIARMVEVHGLLNALGFTFCGLAAHCKLAVSWPR